MRNEKWKYSLTAGALGLGWFVILLLPSMTRQWLIEDIFLNIVFLIFASVLVALIGRKHINRAETFGGYLVRAALMPYFGTILFLTMWNLLTWGKTLMFGGLANLHDTLSLYYMGLVAVTISFYIVIPYGFFCQYMMQRVSDTD